MLTRVEFDKADLMDRLVEEATHRLGDDMSPEMERFLRHYYAYVPPRDLVAERPATLYGAALAHWKFAARRPPGTATLRVYNPQLESDGWRSEHTVLEIANDDMPFLVDSVNAALLEMGLTVLLVIHPIFTCRRDDAGNLLGLAEPGEPDAVSESFMHVEVAGQPEDSLQGIHDRVVQVLDDVRAAVADWQAMRSRLHDAMDAIHADTAGIPEEMAEETRAFLQWVHDDHFTFLGCRDHDLVAGGNGTVLVPADDSGMGILRDSARRVFDGHSREIMTRGTEPPMVRALLETSDILYVTKSNLRSTVHRPVFMDAIGVKRFDDSGRVVGQRLFVGLFTSAAYNRTPRDIPLLRRKLHNTMARSEFSPGSHDGKALMNILETFPRDELFPVSEDHLFETSMGILHLQERQRVAAFLHRDAFERYISVMIYIPRDCYTYVLRQRMRMILEKAFAGEMASFKAELGDSPLVRLHMIINTAPGQIPDYDAQALEAQLAEAARTWSDHLREALVVAHGEERGQRLLTRYGEAFPSAYQERFNAEATLGDIDQLEETQATGAATLNLYRPIEDAGNQLRLKIYNPERPLPLSDVLPMLEHMGLRVIDEVPHEIHPRDGAIGTVLIHDLGLVTRDGREVDVGDVRVAFQDAFSRVSRREIESDGFNGLVLMAGLHWREVALLRAMCKFLRQAGITYSQDYMERTLANHADLTEAIVDLFKARFDPAEADTDARAEAIMDGILEGLDAVESADEDRILRRFLNLIQSLLRTNYFQTGADGQPRPYISFKFKSRKIEELPLPRPWREIFVYSPRFEAVHLRFGPVARGGLRWSDRPEDFRTEILGLVKAQQVKNTVIVPVGSKGGFVLKQAPAPGDREAFMAEGIACYRLFITAMLEITDNLDGGDIVPPPQVVRRDRDDPYLVVAADKGTATFSDYANDVSVNHGFWLGDAFASGGSQGYDHKGMGITARGAWESVKRHFREMGVDTQSEDFTVVGVGDMSGDVFGNGMLLSKHIKLLAAFNHLHIFVDPDPDPATSFAERQRLFDLPRSSWSDYDTGLLSKGGAVYPRSAKTLKLTPEIMQRFGLTDEEVTPAALLRALLGAEVDLLWFGGIGTYVKASTESHADAGDRSNDAIRLNGGQLCCKVIGEGANLGVTQRGRIEYSLAGGRLNTDFIDNSAGVDTSDHEVNIKVLLDAVVTSGDMTGKQRNETLAAMTEEVGEQVLRNNYQQSNAITLARSRGVVGLENDIRLMRMLERAGRLDRGVEFLPDDETLAERIADKVGLTRPEIAVLLCYAKIWLYDEMLASDLPDDPYLVDDLVTYFPTLLRETYRRNIEDHRLRREIIATRVTNSLINRMGETFASEMIEKTGMPAAEIARAYTISRQVFAFRDIWSSIEALDSTVPADTQTHMLGDLHNLMEWVTLWFLRNGQRPLDIGTHVTEYAAGMGELAACLPDVLPESYREDTRRRAQPYIDHGVPEDMAVRVADLVNLYSGCDIVRMANRRGMDVAEVARLYFATGTRFRLGRLRAAAAHMDAHTHWESLACAALVEELYGHQLSLTGNVLDLANGEADPEAAIQSWIDANQGAVDRAEQILSELWSVDIADVSMIAVASRQLRALVDTSSAQ